MKVQFERQGRSVNTDWRRPLRSAVMPESESFHSLVEVIELVAVFHCPGITACYSEVNFQVVTGSELCLCVYYNESC